MLPYERLCDTSVGVGNPVLYADAGTRVEGEGASILCGNDVDIGGSVVPKVGFAVSVGGFGVVTRVGGWTGSGGPWARDESRGCDRAVCGWLGPAE